GIRDFHVTGVQTCALPICFARVPEEVKRRWQRTLEHYFRSRRSLRGLFLVMDIRRPLGEYDTMMLDWCREMRLPVHVLLTKADRSEERRVGKVWRGRRSPQ